MGLSQHPEEAVSFARAVWERAERDPDGEVIRVPGGPSWTAAQLRDRANQWAVWLSSAVDRGDIVVTRLATGPEAVALTAAVSALGAVECPLAGDTPEAWEKHLLGEMRPAAVVTESDAPAATVREVTPVTLHPTDPAVIISTSGTTGRAKAARLPVGVPIGQASRVATAMDYGPADVLLSYFAWHHVNARHAAVLPALISGARVVLAPRFSASGFLGLVRDEGVTAFNFIGATCSMLLRQPATPDDRNHTVTKAYGGPAPATLVADFAERFGITLRQAYACTELGDVAITPVRELRPGAAGRVVEDHEVRIVDGEIEVRPRRAGLAVLDYVGDPDATAAAWRDGWFRTRDRGRLVDGWLHVDGRVGDVIRRRGINIDPRLVEDAILTHPAVAEAAAIPVPSDLTDDEVCVLVVLREGRSAAAEDLWRHCRDRVPRSAVPRFVHVQPSLPTTHTHKLDRRALRKDGLPEVAWDAQSALAEETL